MSTEIVILGAAHLAAVAEIETLCFASPWSEAALGMLLVPPNGGFAALESDEVAGYIGFLGVLDELEVTNVATHPDFRRRGTGRALVSALLDYARREKFLRVTLEVRASNAPAIALYESLGFAPCGVRKNFYA
ncbi:MAG: ribosomal protein S18-alanine N-acetyltransferase, partial [Clostridia bacterium]|nr:ribosomal protein S18-alanine N-acetyltransferase [Clostridia bacterium]